MYRFLPFVLCLCIGLLLFGCAKKEEAEKVIPPGANAVALWTYIKTTRPYTEYAYWPGHEGFQSGTAPHGPIHKVFVNEIAAKGINPLEVGALVVKENYTPDTTLAAITVMYKIADYNPEAGNWYWAKYTAEGVADMAGKLIGCIGCHEMRKDNDYIMLAELK